jgi:hypothetical protein
MKKTKYTKVRHCTKFLGQEVLRFLGGGTMFIQGATSIPEYVGDLGTILFQLSEGLGLNTRGVADKSIS